MLVELLAAAAVASGPVLVQPQERAAYDALLTDQARAADTLFGGAPCAASKVAPVSTEVVKIGDRPDFAAARVRVRVTGCGRSTVENLHVGRFGGSPPWRMAPGLPGDSLADMRLQQSAWTEARAQARDGLPAGCQGGSLGEVYVAARPGHVRLAPPGAPQPAQVRGTIDLRASPELEAHRASLDLAKAWAEVWPFTLCGQDRTSVVVFMPLRQGGQSLYLFLPVWEQILARGPAAKPAPAPKP